MSMPPEPPERLAKILLEILALSNPTRTNQMESEHGSNPVELIDPHCVKERLQRSDQEDNQR
jgi:hypothetical protein